jgi:hypothetical protein
MQIIWDQAAAARLKNSHTLLELETFSVNGESITAYCVIPAEKILQELPELETYKQLHSEFVCAFNKKNYQLCQDTVEHLRGRFGGELDSFYDAIIDKINNDQSATDTAE